MQIIFFDLKKTPPFFTLLKIRPYSRFSLKHPPPGGGESKKGGGGSAKNGDFVEI